MVEASLLYPTSSIEKDPAVAAQKFSSTFNAKFGDDHVELYADSYSKALAHAKRELLFMLVYLHSPEHDDTDKFCAETICSPILTDFLRDRNVILWAGDVSDQEAFRLANDILLAPSFPFLCLICLKDGRMQAVHRIDDMLPVQELVDQLSAAVDSHGQTLIMERADRNERDLSRRLREEQDRAYQESLRKDQEKEKLRQQEELKLKRLQELEAKKLEQERLRKRNMLLMKSELKESLPAEPADGQQGITKIVFRLPDGSRCTRLFMEMDTIGLLYHYASTLELQIDNDFRICSNFPRTFHTDKSMTLKDAGLSPNGMVVVEEIYEEGNGD
eukprot:Partr_v1_DN25919_c0_g1_i1_m68677 putative Fas associated factor family member 2